MDLACQKLGAVVVPIYPTLSPAVINYIIEDSRPKVLVVENAGLFETISAFSPDVTGEMTRIPIDTAKPRIGKCAGRMRHLG
jgi:long-subunit acyl-CoA synthetase (AMP-forming)